MKNFSNILAVIAAVLTLGSCVYEFYPKAEELEGQDEGVVVIEGDIVVGGITSVSVGYSLPLQAEPGVDGNLNFWKASVWVESEDGRVWGGEPSGTGKYNVDTRELDVDGTYRLCVSIPSQGEYVSEFRKVLVSPQIEELSYSVPQDSSCVHIEVSTKGESGKTGYYKWEYEEAWDASPQIMPQLEYEPKTRLMAYMGESRKEGLKKCFGVAESADILIANTEKLQQNIISGNRVVTIGAADSRIAKDYCITVKQTCMDKDGYTYWEAMKKNTSGTGGLFAPQPSEVRGNITSTLNPDEMVIGYVNVATESMQRLFIRAGETGVYDNLHCSMSITYYNEVAWYNAYTKYGMRPVSYLKSEGGEDIITEAHWAPKACVEPEICNKKPEYWPEDMN